MSAAGCQLSAGDGRRRPWEKVEQLVKNSTGEEREHLRWAAVSSRPSQASKAKTSEAGAAGVRGKAQRATQLTSPASCAPCSTELANKTDRPRLGLALVLVRAALGSGQWAVG